MKHLSSIESLTYYREKLYLPFDKNGKQKNSMIYVLNQSMKSIGQILNNDHPIISNEGNYYHTYYYDFNWIPKSIKSNRVKNTGLYASGAKKDRFADYAEIKKECESVDTPLLTRKNGPNIIIDMNPVIRLYEKQSKLKSLPLRESITTFLDTVQDYCSHSIVGYTNYGIFVNLDEYNSTQSNLHILTYIMLLLKRSDKFIDSMKYDFRILFYTTNGYFLLDAKTDLKKSNFFVIQKLIKRLKPSISVDKDIDNLEKVEVQRYLAAKATASNFSGDDSELSPDEIIDKDSDIVDTVYDKIDDIEDLEDDAKTSELDEELLQDEKMKREYEEALVMKSTGKKKSDASLKRDEMLREKQRDIMLKTKTLGQISAEKTIAPLPTHKIEVESITNENMANMKFPEFNKTYMETMYENDIGSMINSITEDKSINVHIIDIKVEDTSDELTLKETYTVTLEDEHRRRHTMKFALPKVIDNEFIKINGSYKTIQNQMTTFPVIKVSPERVQICTNYNKIFIDRIGAKFSASSDKFRKLLDKNGDKIIVTKGCNTSINREFLTNLEYDEFAKTYNTLKIGKATFDFNRKRLAEMFPDYKENLGEYLVGYENSKTPIIYKTSGPEASNYADFISFMVQYGGEELYSEFSSYSTGKKFVRTSMYVMRKHIPTIVAIAYFEGLTKVIQKFNDPSVHYTDKKEDSDMNYYIKFADGYLTYPKSNMEACILFNGLQEFGTAQYTIDEMDNRVTYLDIFNVVSDGGIGLADALLNYYDWMIDPISKDILQMLNYPTDLVSLIIFANNLLADSYYTTDIDMNMYRIRSMEVISALLYKNIARSYSRYRRTANNPNPVKITMDENAVIKELVALPTVEDYSKLSPMVELHKQGLVSMKGNNGMNTDRAYKLEKRAYHDSMLGVIGMSTDIASNCGKIKQMVAEPTIINARGFMDLNNRKDPDKLLDVNLSTPVELLTPMTAINDDPNRNAMASKQTGHVIPVENNCPALVSTGMDQIVHYRTGNDFSVVAKNAGKVVKLDRENNLMLVQYKDGSKQAIDIAPHVVKNGGGGFYLMNQLSPRFKEGQSFKKDDILAYDPKYYKEQGRFGNRLTMGSLQKVVVMSNYATYEDSNMVTKHMSESMATNITMPHKLILGANANVDYIVNVGDSVIIGDDLIRYETSYDDAELNKMLSNIRDDMKEQIVNLGKSQLHAHYTGIVSDIDIVCTVPPEQLSPSLKKIVSKYQASIRKKKKVLDDFDPDTKDATYRMGMVISKSDGVTKADEYGKVQGEYIGDGVRFIFYVTYHDEVSDGDKMAGWTANKNTIGYQIPRGFEPYSEFRPYEEISSTIAPSAVLQRGTPSVITTGCCYKVLIELKRKLYEILTGENYDEILKQKQPWMDRSKKTEVKEYYTLPVIPDNEIAILEQVSDLYPDALNKYRSERYYNDGDTILTLSNDLDMTPMLEKFQLVDEGYNAVLNDNLIIAIADILPNTKILLKL